MLTHWNVVATAATLQLRHLPALLCPYGAFVHTGFRGVMVGVVEAHEPFFEALLARQARKPEALRVLARLVPVERTFAFAPDDLPALLEAGVAPYLDQIGDGAFYVRVERRGHKGELHTQPLEQALDRHIQQRLRDRGHRPSVSFADPDLIVVVEMLGDECGVGRIPRAWRERYPFVRVR